MYKIFNEDLSFSISNPKTLFRNNCQNVYDVLDPSSKNCYNDNIKQLFYSILLKTNINPNIINKIYKNTPNIFRPVISDKQNKDYIKTYYNKDNNTIFINLREFFNIQKNYKKINIIINNNELDLFKNLVLHESIHYVCYNHSKEIGQTFNNFITEIYKNLYTKIIPNNPKLVNLFVENQIYFAIDNKKYKNNFISLLNKYKRKYKYLSDILLIVTNYQKIEIFDKIFNETYIKYFGAPVDKRLTLFQIFYDITETLAVLPNVNSDKAKQATYLILNSL